MSIVTKTGDEGETSLMYGRRVPKNDSRVKAYGAVDELTAAEAIERIQLDLEPLPFAIDCCLNCQWRLLTECNHGKY